MKKRYLLLVVVMLFMIGCADRPCTINEDCEIDEVCDLEQGICVTIPLNEFICGDGVCDLDEVCDSDCTMCLSDADCGDGVCGLDGFCDYLLDLRIDAITCDSEILYSGEPYSCSIDIAYDGVSASFINFDSYVNNVYNGRISLNLVPGIVNTIAFNDLVGPEGVFDIRVVADPDNIIKETDETNNEFLKHVEVNPSEVSSSTVECDTSKEEGITTYTDQNVVCENDYTNHSIYVEGTSDYTLNNFDVGCYELCDNENFQIGGTSTALINSANILGVPVFRNSAVVTIQDSVIKPLVRSGAIQHAWIMDSAKVDFLNSYIYRPHIGYATNVILSFTNSFVDELRFASSVGETLNVNNLIENQYLTGHLVEGSTKNLYFDNTKLLSIPAEITTEESSYLNIKGSRVGLISVAGADSNVLIDNSKFNGLWLVSDSSVNIINSVSPITDIHQKHFVLITPGVGRELSISDSQLYLGINIPSAITGTPFVGQAGYDYIINNLVQAKALSGSNFFITSRPGFSFNLDNVVFNNIKASVLDNDYAQVNNSAMGHFSVQDDALLRSFNTTLFDFIIIDRGTAIVDQLSMKGPLTRLTLLDSASITFTNSTVYTFRHLGDTNYSGWTGVPAIGLPPQVISDIDNVVIKGNVTILDKELGRVYFGEQTSVIRSYPLFVYDGEENLVAGATVKIYDKNKNLLFDGVTNSKGYVELDVTFDKVNYKDDFTLQVDWNPRNVTTFNLLSDTPVMIEGGIELDADGDGFINPYFDGDDCNDDDPLIHPGATEVCDGVDNDCDGSIDEGYVNTRTTCGKGICLGTLGWLICEGGVEVDTCDPFAKATEEGCYYMGDAADANCDGKIDDNCEEYCYDHDNDGYYPYLIGVQMNNICAALDLPTKLGVGDCNNYDPLIHPGATEVCDGVDNDCDGLIDESLTQSTSCGIGACSATGSLQCINGKEVDSCVPGSPAPADTTCDNIDDDCNGVADEDYIVTSTTCGIGACASSGLLECISGSEVDSCVPGSPAPSDASCNNVDDNCNGLTDEDYVADESCFLPGACAVDNAASSCVAGVETFCSTGIPGVEICNNVDDNCDGIVDESLTQPTTCGVGACSGNTGIETCSAGEWLGDTCDPLAGASLDDASCDNIDDDCNGVADEDYVTAPTTCGIGACASSGSLECIDGFEVDSCVEGTPVTADTSCDGVDDDCDGLIDDPFYCAPCTDSDEGINIDEFGEVCKGGLCEPDSCSRNSLGQEYVLEGYCLEGAVASQQVLCEGACQDGVCLPFEIVSEEGCKNLGEATSFDVDCCGDLVKKSNAKVVGDECELFTSSGLDTHICLNCGDGACDEAYENKCNCPEDCIAEICDGLDNNQNGEIDEVCDKDLDSILDYYDNCPESVNVDQKNIDTLENFDGTSEYLSAEAVGSSYPFKLISDEALNVESGIILVDGSLIEQNLKMYLYSEKALPSEYQLRWNVKNIQDLGPGLDYFMGLGSLLNNILPFESTAYPSHANYKISFYAAYDIAVNQNKGVILYHKEDGSVLLWDNSQKKWVSYGSITGYPSAFDLDLTKEYTFEISRLNNNYILRVYADGTTLITTIILPVEDVRSGSDYFALVDINPSVAGTRGVDYSVDWVSLGDAIGDACEVIPGTTGTTGGSGGGGGGSRTCNPSWSCYRWETCADGTQTRTCVDLNHCSNARDRPVLEQTCVVAPRSTEEIEEVCVENWECGDWSECINSVHTRDCIETNLCGTVENEPVENESCVADSHFGRNWWKYLIGLLLILLLLALLEYIRRKMKQEEFVQMNQQNLNNKTKKQPKKNVKKRKK